MTRRAMQVDPFSLTVHPEIGGAIPPYKVLRMVRFLERGRQTPDVVVSPNGTVLEGHAVVMAACQLAWTQMTVTVVVDLRRKK